MRNFAVHLEWLCLVVLIVGCSRNDIPKLATVDGTITLNGKPLSGATVSFIPTGSTHGMGANGHTDKAGKYELKTRSGDKGAPPGEYRIVVTKMVMPDGSDLSIDSTVAPINSPAKQILPAKYSMRDKTVLRAKVGDRASIIDFPLSYQP